MWETIHEMFSKEQIEERVSQIAAQLNEKYEGKELHLIGILRGSIFFFTALAQKLTMPVTMDFMAAASYRNSTESAGELDILKDLDDEITGKHCLVVEDIVDTGTTLDMVKRILLARNPASLEICVLLDKPSRRETEVAAEYVGFTVQDAFMVGFGLDYAQKYRNLPYIASLNFEE